MQRDHAADRREGRGHDQGLEARQPDGGVVLLSRDVHRSTQGAGHQVRGREAPVRPSLPEARDRGEDEAGLCLSQDLVAQTELVQPAGWEGFDVRGLQGQLEYAAHKTG